MRFSAFHFPLFDLGKRLWPAHKGVLAAFFLLGLASCSREEAANETFVPNTGQIQVLNGCGKSGAAELFRNFLTDQGFDIIEFGNAASWNYTHTLVVARTENLPVARDLAKVMGTDKLVHLFDPLAMVDATVFVGKDYEELIKRWQKRKP
jgi:hypothetical protein